MSIKSKVLAATATLTLAGGLAAAPALSAGAATPSCGGGFIPPYSISGCIGVFSHKFGDYGKPNYVLDVFRQGAHVGQPIILYRTSNADPAEDFVLSYQGQVSDFYAAGLVSAQVELHYGGAKFLQTTNAQTAGVDEPAFELEYAPYGVGSGLCVGSRAGRLPAVGTTKVSLQPCGVDGRTVWIWDTFDQGPDGVFGPYQAFINDWTFPAINGADTNFSHPSVLDYPHNGDPTDKPRPQLTVQNLTGFSSGFGPIVGSVIDTQLWGGRFGVLP